MLYKKTQVTNVPAFNLSLMSLKLGYIIQAMFFIQASLKRQNYLKSILVMTLGITKLN
jgi:hypothetical protein